jgi:hypothetical protein
VSVPRRLGKPSSGVQAVAVGILLVAPSLIWIFRDHSVWPWDPAWYGQVSVDLWSTLRLHPAKWPSAMVHAFGAKPPGIAWFGQLFVPFGYKFGNVRASLLLSSVACQIATVALLFAAGRKLTGSVVAGLATALLVAAGPLFVSMSHEFFAEPLQTLSFAWLLYVLSSASTWRPALTISSVFAAVALGLLAKLSTPFYMVFPAIGALLLAYRAPCESRSPWAKDWRVVAATLSGVVFAFGDAGWYWVNWAAAKAHADTVNSSLYGGRAGIGDKLGWWLPHFAHAAFLPVIDWFAIGVVTVAVGLIIARRTGLQWNTVTVIAANVASIATVLILLADHPAEEIRYTLPLVASLAVAVVGIIYLSQSRALLLVLSAALVVEFAGTTAQSFGSSVARRGQPVITGPTSPSFLGDLKDVVKSTCTPEANNRLSIVGTEYAFLNANTLSFLAAARFDLQDRRCYYTSLGYAETDPGRAWRRVLAFRPAYYVSLDFARPTNALPQTLRTPADAFNRVDRKVFANVITSRHFSIVRGSRRDGLIVFRGIWDGG